MPAASKSTNKSNKVKPSPITSFPPEEDSELADQISTALGQKKRGRNAAARQKDQTNSTEPHQAEVTRGSSLSPSRPQSILGQIPYSSFTRNPAATDVHDVLEESVKVSDQYTSRTDAWANGIPYGKSPPGNSTAGDFIGESPPVQPGYLGRGGFHNKTPPISPAPRKARPVSFGSTVPPMPLRQPSGDRGHRYSMSNYGSPPAPHLPQPHFYAAQDVDLGIGPYQRAVGEGKTHFVAFGDLPGQSSASSRKGVFLGSTGRLDILACSLDGKYDPIGALYDISGDVLDAAILSWDFGEDPYAHLRPLVAITVHGPKQESNRVIADNESVATGIQGTFTDAERTHQYETRVEVYSLRERCLISILLSIQSLAFPSLGHGTLSPDSMGLRLEARGNHLIISCGSSGEIFVCGITITGAELAFECLAKFWTSVQHQAHRRESSQGRSPMVDAGQELEPRECTIFSLSNRWLAICPPGSAHRQSAAAHLSKSTTKRSRASTGVDSRSAPARPPVSCGIESPDVDTLFGKLARGVAQEVVKGAKWLGDQGMQTWNNYWNKDQLQQLPPPPISNLHLYSPRQQPQLGMFPPTHASETVSREPDVVSIIDLKSLTIVATFQPPGGCSFLSFMPNGLGILTASKKGDVQYVWDLMQMKHVRNTSLMVETTAAEVTAPRVRQLAKFERLTSSTIVNVVWEPAMGERFALVTKKGTVHLFDLPASVFRWPPPRQTGRIRPATAPSNPTSPTGEQEPAPASSFLASAMNMASMTQPLLANFRGRAPSLNQGLSGIGSSGIGIASATGVRSGRAVATGLSKSLGAASGTVQNMRHAGESRLHVEFLANQPASARIAWSKRGQKTVLSILDRGVVKNYYISKGQTRDKSNRAQKTSVFGRKAVNFKLPSLSILANTTASRQNPIDIQLEDGEARPMSGYWISELSRRSNQSSRKPHPLSHAEIESNAPYQPFHSDPRVNLYVTSEYGSFSESQLPTASVMFGAQTNKAAKSSVTAERWVFGEPISVTKLSIRSSPPANEGEHDPQGSVIYRETSSTTVLDGGAMPDHIVSTTRKKKVKRVDQSVLEAGGEGTEADQEGFFENDCDVLDFAGDRV